MNEVVCDCEVCVIVKKCNLSLREAEFAMEIAGAMVSSNNVREQAEKEGIELTKPEMHTAIMEMYNVALGLKDNHAMPPNTQLH